MEASLSPLELLFLGTAQGLTVIAAEVPAGVFADAYSRRWSLVLAHALMGLGIFSTGLVLSFPALVFTQMIWGLSWTFSSGADVAWMTNLSTAIVSAGIGMWCLGAAVSMRFPETNFERAQPGELLSVAMHTLKQGLHRVLVHILVCTYLVNGADEAFGRLHANSILLIGGIAMSVMRTVSVVWANKNASNEVRATIQSSPQLWWVAVSS